MWPFKKKDSPEERSMIETVEVEVVTYKVTDKEGRTYTTTRAGYATFYLSSVPFIYPPSSPLEDCENWPVVSDAPLTRIRLEDIYSVAETYKGIAEHTYMVTRLYRDGECIGIKKAVRA